MPANSSLDCTNPDSPGLNNLVLCIKWGNKYNADYVNRLQRMAERNLTNPFHLVCFTDDSKGIDPAIQTLPLPELGCEAPMHTRGQWRKLALWAGSLQGLEGVGLFIDLDSVIVGNIDAYFSYGNPDDVILERNWARPLTRLGQTSVFRFPIGSHPEVLERFQRNPQAIADRFEFEQHFVTSCLGAELKFWPSGWTRHFRLHSLGSFPLNYLRQPHIPKNSKIITFPGGPNPSDARIGKWRPNSPPYRGRRAHIKQSLTNKSWQQLRRFVMPTQWINQHWR